MGVLSSLTNISLELCSEASVDQPFTDYKLWHLLALLCEFVVWGESSQAEISFSDLFMSEEFFITTRSPVCVWLWRLRGCVLGIYASISKCGWKQTQELGRVSTYLCPCCLLIFAVWKCLHWFLSGLPQGVLRKSAVSRSPSVCRICNEFALTSSSPSFAAVSSFTGILWYKYI